MYAISAIRLGQKIGMHPVSLPISKSHQEKEGQNVCYLYSSPGSDLVLCQLDDGLFTSKGVQSFPHTAMTLLPCGVNVHSSISKQA